MRTKKKAFLLEDEFSRTLIKGALKSLKWVSIMFMDLKFAGIVAMLEAYVEEQERKIKEKEKPVEPLLGYERFDDPSQPGMPSGYYR